MSVVTKIQTGVKVSLQKWATSKPHHAKGTPGKTGRNVPARPVNKRSPAQTAKKMSISIQIFYDIIFFMTIYEEKNLFRKKMNSIIKEMTFNQNEICIKKSNEVCKKVLELNEFKEAEIVFVYIPLKNELDCMKIAEFALNQNKKVCVPKVVSETKMEFFYLQENQKISSQLEKGSFGILEPKNDLLKVEFETAEKENCLLDKKIFIVVPGVAFSDDGKRLGKGKGFYDRFFERLKNADCSFKTCGVCFSEQLVENIPLEKTDFLLDKVIFA